MAGKVRRALDLFCAAGGVTRGLQRAGFHVTGVDIRPQPRYCGDEFHVANALEFPLDGFDFIWASPPCQAHTALKAMYNAKAHADLIPATRARLAASGRPYCIENVQGAPLINPGLLCGTMFDLGCDTAELRRHRLFECSFPMSWPRCRHGRKPEAIGVYGGHVRNRRRIGGSRGQKDFTPAEGKASMGIDWMTLAEMSQAIPPAYSEFIGRWAMELICAPDGSR